jgi:hypothetical protein
VTTPMRDEEVADAYRRGVAARTPISRASCPTPDQLRALSEMEGDVEGRLLVLDHVMACAACAPEFALLQAVRAARGQPAGRVRLVSKWTAIAAGAVVAIGGSALVGRWTLDRSRADVGRGGTSATAATAGVGLLPPSADSSGGVAFRWRAVTGAVRYDVEVLDRGSLVVRRTTADTAVVVPLAAARQATEWWVRATTADGAERRSAVISVRIP